MPVERRVPSKVGAPPSILNRGILAISERVRRLRHETLRNEILPSLRCLGEGVVAGTLLAWLLRPLDVVCRRNMGEGLRKIAQQPFGGGIILFRQQAEII